MVGGGKVGYQLAASSRANGHEVTLIEKDTERARELAEDLNLLVLCGDGSRSHILTEAETGRAHVFVAVTGADQDNLIACQLAKKVFGVHKTIARINNPKNENLVEELGVDVGVSSTGVIGTLLEQELLADQLRTLVTFNQGDMVLVELRLHDSSAIAGQSVLQLAPELPAETLLVAIIRAGQMIVPKGDTVLLAGDQVVAMTHTERASALESLFSE
jgi:trk system potassium uptake protein TrkA